MTDSKCSAALLFRAMVKERRDFMRGTRDWNYRTRAARQYLMLARGVPVSEWASV